MDLTPREMIAIAESLALDIDLGGCTPRGFARAVERALVLRGRRIADRGIGRKGSIREHLAFCVGLPPSTTVEAICAAF